MQGWEYRTMMFVGLGDLMVGTKQLDAVLKAAGSEGWELVATIPASDPKRASVLIFKRPASR